MPKEVRAYLAEEVVSATVEDERSTGSGLAKFEQEDL